MLKTIAAVGVLLTTAIGAPLAGFAILPTIKKKEPEWSDVGTVDDLKINQPVERRFFQTVRSGYYEEKVERTAWVLKRADDKVIAYSPSCPHLGCGYRWDESANEFKCPCHASIFDLDGLVLGGPAPRKLDVLETKMESGKVFVKFRIFQAGTERQVEG